MISLASTLGKFTVYIMTVICHFIRLYLVPLPPYVKVNEEKVVFEDTIESGKVPESAFGLLKTYWNLAWFGGIHVLLQWKVPKGDPNFSPKLFLDTSELTVIKNSFSQAILEQLSVNLNKSKVELTTCFNEFSEYDSLYICLQRAMDNLIFGSKHDRKITIVLGLLTV